MGVILFIDHLEHVLETVQLFVNHVELGTYGHIGVIPEELRRSEFLIDS